MILCAGEFKSEKPTQRSTNVSKKYADSCFDSPSGIEICACLRIFYLHLFFVTLVFLILSL